jgi:hypothetical protein
VGQLSIDSDHLRDAPLVCASVGRWRCLFRRTQVGLTTERDAAHAWPIVPETQDGTRHMMAVGAIAGVKLLAVAAWRLEF